MGDADDDGSYAELMNDGLLQDAYASQDEITDNHIAALMTIAYQLLQKGNLHKLAPVLLSQEESSSSDSDEGEEENSVKPNEEASEARDSESESDGDSGEPADGISIGESEGEVDEEELRLKSRRQIEEEDDEEELELMKANLSVPKFLDNEADEEDDDGRIKKKRKGNNGKRIQDENEFDEDDPFIAPEGNPHKKETTEQKLKRKLDYAKRQLKKIQKEKKADSDDEEEEQEHVSQIGDEDLESFNIAGKGQTKSSSSKEAPPPPRKRASLPDGMTPSLLLHSQNKLKATAKPPGSIPEDAPKGSPKKRKRPSAASKKKEMFEVGSVFQLSTRQAVRITYRGFVAPQERSEVNGKMQFIAKGVLLEHLSTVNAINAGEGGLWNSTNQYFHVMVGETGKPQKVNPILFKSVWRSLEMKDKITYANMALEYNNLKVDKEAKTHQLFFGTDFYDSEIRRFGSQSNENGEWCWNPELKNILPAHSPSAAAPRKTAPKSPSKPPVTSGNSSSKKKKPTSSSSKPIAPPTNNHDVGAMLFKTAPAAAVKKEPVVTTAAASSAVPSKVEDTWDIMMDNTDRVLFPGNKIGKFFLEFSNQILKSKLTTNASLGAAEQAQKMELEYGLLRQRFEGCLTGNGGTDLIALRQEYSKDNPITVIGYLLPFLLSDAATPIRKVVLGANSSSSI